MSSQQIVVARTPAELNTFLQQGKDAISLALPKHLNADRMLRLALTSFSTTPKLRECSMKSILGSLVIASQMGLEPGVNGQGYLIPYFNRHTGENICTFVPGWKGLVGLVNNSGRALVWTGCVFAGDTFEFELGAHPKCRHIPNGLNAGDPNKIEWVYACGQLKGSDQTIIEAWRMERVLRHRDKTNKVGKSHYSYEHPEMYGRKVVLLQVLKYMPSSIELSNAIVASEASEAGRQVMNDGGVIIDMPEMPEGGFGAGQGGPGPGGPGPAASTTTAEKPPETVTEMAAREAAEAATGGDGAAGKTTEDVAAAKDKPPAAGKKADPKADLLKMMGSAGASRSRVLTVAAEKQIIGSAKAWADLTLEEAAAIIEAWDSVMLPELKPQG